MDHSYNIPGAFRWQRSIVKIALKTLDAIVIKSGNFTVNPAADCNVSIFKIQIMGLC